jgi:membrane-associated protein
MNLTDQLLAAFSLYGYPVLFGVVAVASLGVPCPATFMLIVVGSFVAQGDLNLWWVIALASGGAIVGDQIGYGLGRKGGRRLALKVSRKFGGSEIKLQQAEAFSKKWGGAGIFFSRWLVTPLGPWLNLTSGITNYPWPRFLLWDVLGEVLWVVLCIILGKIFSDRVQALGELLGNLTWLILGLIVVVVLGWKLTKYSRSTRDVKGEDAQLIADPAP